MLKKIITIASFPMLLLAARFVPFDRLPTSCAFFLLTGYPCPTCGMTRAVIAITHLDLACALRMNPLGFAFVGGVAIWWIASVYWIANRKRLRAHEWAIRKTHLLVLLVFIVLLLFDVFRIWTL